jgi:hypothetical protein
VKYSYDNTQTNISLNTTDYKTTFKNIILPLVLTRSENCKRCCYVSIRPRVSSGTNAQTVMKGELFISTAMESYAPIAERNKQIYGHQRCREDYSQSLTGILYSQCQMNYGK